ncbi:MAG: methylmalonyl-CoA mutase family protein [Candidatus Kapabacteria bacterium]|jgi:methylmalonyl-CoA mutase|nr:methylmalonyl-CoA mutase family protein [Candidatus Kapabacteria bacterium]
MDKIKVLTATSLFDGHDVSVNIFRRLLQKGGAEVIHLGHNRSVSELIKVALQEDVDALLVSSYQGGHNEYFKFLVDELHKHGAGDKLVFGGGGGVILPAEIDALQKYGVCRLYHALDGQEIGIDGITEDIIKRIEDHRSKIVKYDEAKFTDEYIKNNPNADKFEVARQLTFMESSVNSNIDEIRERYQANDLKKSLVLGVTGTGGSGKSSVIDEFIGRMISYTDDIRVAVLAVDPSKSRSGGALLGDRIRYNQIYHDRAYFRSFATRDSSSELSAAIKDSIAVLKSCGYDFIIVETSGIGQGNSGVAEICDSSVYVMTAEFGGPSQLEKIDMLEIADFIVINKFEKIGSEDAFREVMIHYLRTREVGGSMNKPLEELGLPVYPCSANQFNNGGINKLFIDLYKKLKDTTGADYTINNELVDMLPTKLNQEFGLINTRRINYLAEITDTVRDYKSHVDEQCQAAGDVYALKETIKQIEDKPAIKLLKETFESKWNALDDISKKAVSEWDLTKKNMSERTLKYKIQSKEFEVDLFTKSLSGSAIPKIALPKFTSWPEILRWILLENLPGFFPYTAGVFPFKRTTEDPKRQFAGEGGPARTNKRFHYLCENDDAKRLSVAFDGITLYGEDPAENPDIYGKIGESGVSICTIDDMRDLLAGFDLLDPLTSVSMTINAPAPIMVAFYFMTAYRAELVKAEAAGSKLNDSDKAELKMNTFRRLRGTVQADMLKEDQGQNTCVFSMNFAMKLIGDLQEYLSQNQIKNYYSISVSGYHIAEAGANPITQLALTLANGFTYVEYFLSRGMKIDDFAPNLSFFFSNGPDPEYSVIGRVARRIWAVAMRDKYGANAKSQKLKYHIQTSGRSLHAQEIDFNDIRTTLQGLLAFYDNCNSLHTNSYDEAVTTPTEESVRRSMAIQMILSKEFGMLKNENPNQGSFIIEELTDLTEEAVLNEFNNISRRGGVLGAMETQYQRSKIQEESMYYEYLKQSGEYPIIGVNTFLPTEQSNPYGNMLITRASDEEKNSRLQTLYAFQEEHQDASEAALDKLREVVLRGGNVFEELLNTVEHVSMGQITNVLYEIGGKYRRGM